MRSTRASAAVERLKARSGNSFYALSTRADGRFALRLNCADGQPETAGEPLTLDDFVRFVDSLGPQKVKRVSKLDTAFRKQLERNKTTPG